ncbi:MAG: arginase family protein [Caulobacter sp.]|nr:arginase family protein [Caulobacter sp.]
MRRLSDRLTPVLLDLDGAFEDQGALVEETLAAGGDQVAARDLGPALRLWSRPPALEALRDRLRQSAPAGPSLVFTGSGDFHHVSPLLIERAIEASWSGPVTVLHFDNHPDWVRFENGMHCGSWVGRAARLPGVAKVITVGVCSRDIAHPTSRSAHLDLVEDGRLELYAYRAPDGGSTVRVGRAAWPTVESQGEDAFIDFLSARIQTDAVYVTIDKDVLRHEDAATNWDQGRTSLAFLEAMLARILDEHRLIGADVVGDWTRPRYGGGLAAGLLKRAEAMLDQPWSPPRPALRQVNEGVNRRLLRMFVQTAA